MGICVNPRLIFLWHLAQNSTRRYFARVTSLSKCSQCGAELLPDTNFCRRCGATANTNGISPSESPTQVLEPPANLTTSRLESRTTSPDRALRRAIANVTIEEPVPEPRQRRRAALIGGAVAFLVRLGVLATVAYVQIRSHSSTIDDAKLIYPGSKTIVDVSSGDGRAIQLQTNDSMERVIAWYETNLKPTKTMRLTSTSIVLKNDKVTTTLATEAGKTNILIKQIK